jgi:hypothetical protein
MRNIIGDEFITLDESEILQITNLSFYEPELFFSIMMIRKNVKKSIR